MDLMFPSKLYFVGNFEFGTLFMRTFFYCLLLGMGVTLAQTGEKAEIQQSIEHFFQGFHARDSTTIMKAIHPGLVLQTIARNNEGNYEVKSESPANFIQSLAKLPDSIEFREDILDYIIQIDGPLAHAWTPYEFHVDGTLSHCGVNSFQLVKGAKGWKIVYLIDTRRREGCEEE